MSVLLEKVPPQNVEAEQAVLGSILLDSQSLYVAMEFLRPEDFYLEAHRVIYQVFLEMADRGQAVDAVTVAAELTRRGLLDKIGGASYLASLAGTVPTAANIAHYSRIVADKSLLRALIRAGTEIVEKAYAEEEEPDQLLDAAEAMIFGLSRERNRQGPVPIGELLQGTFNRLEFLISHKGEVTGVPTFRDLDKYLSGLQPSDLIICAARPGMGKTSFCLNIAQGAAQRHGVPVLIFSLEMSAQQVAERMLAAAAMVDQHKLRTGFLNEAEWRSLVEAVGPLSTAPIFVDDTPAATAMEIRAKARRMKAEHDIGLVVVDYLQLMRSYGRAETRQQEVAQISRALKALARELNVPVLVLSQLNRGVESRQDKRPVMADLLESGAIEADADVVLFLYRPEYYDRDTDKKGIAEVIIGKHRNGPVGTVELGFFAEFTRFVDLAPEDMG